MTDRSAHPRRRRMAALSVALLAFFCVTGPAQAAERLRVLLDWFVNPDHGSLVVAKERGLFAKHGLDVELIAPADPNDPPKLVAAKQADLAVSYQPQLHLQAAEGLPLVRVATLVATPLATLIALEDGPVKTLADLKGRKVAYSVAFYRDLLLPAMLGSAGLAPDAAETVLVNFALSQALLSKRVDATIGAFRNFELNEMAIAGVKARPFYPEEHGVPAYDELIVIAHRDSLGDKRLRPFVDALGEAVQYMVNHPDESWRLFVRANPSLDDELNRRAWRDTLPRLALRPAALDTARYRKFAAFLESQRLVKAQPPLATYAVELP